MSLQTYDIEIEAVEAEEFVQPDCDADDLAQTLQADFVQAEEFEEDEPEFSPPPLRRFADCPPLAFAGIVCATLSFASVLLFVGFVVRLLLWSMGLR
jgi:hypothetical protein